MNYKSQIAILILIASVFAATPANAQMSPPAPGPEVADSPAPNDKIVTGDADYLKLLNPPQGDDFLQTYSQAYRDASQEIDASVAGIADENLRSQARSDAWTKVLQKDGDKFRYEAEMALRESKIAFLRKHRDGWFEIGRISYDEINRYLIVEPNSASPIYAAFHVPFNTASLATIQAKFHEIGAPEIESKARDYVSRAGEGSNCARNADWCYTYAKQHIEQDLRAERVIAVAEADLEAAKINRLLLIDSRSEAILLDLGAPALTSIGWRFSVGPEPIQPVEKADATTPAQTAPAEPPIKVPANVVAASIVTKTEPQYPAKARAKRIEGEVILRATIDRDGKIAQVQVLSGDDELAEPAVHAVRQWRYKPMLVDGEAREIDTTITVTFSLKD